MKIAVYYPWIHTKGGSEKVLLEYLKRSKNETVVFTHYYNPGTTFQEFKNYKIKTISSEEQIKSGLSRGLQFGLKIMNAKLDLSNFDALLVLTSGIGELITFNNHSLPTVCYCHTPLRTVHDFYDYELDSHKNVFDKMKIAFFSGVYRMYEKRAWKYFNTVLCNSENTKNKIIRYGLFRKENIEVAYPGVDILKFKKGRPKKFFFYPSRYKPYKRQALAVAAFKIFARKKKGFKFVLAGPVDDKAYFNKLKTLADKNVVFKEAVSDKEMIKFYSSCYAVLFTPKDEDWGIVPVEAMASGKPVIGVNEGGIRESILDNETGFLVNANPNEIAAKMVKLVEDKKLYGKMSVNAIKRSRLFTWDIMAEKIDKALESVSRSSP